MWIIKFVLFLSTIIFLVSCTVMDSTYLPYVDVDESEKDLEKKRNISEITGFIAIVIGIISVYFAHIHHIWFF